MTDSSFPHIPPVLSRVMRGWMAQLAMSEEAIKIFEEFPEHQIDITLYAANGQVARKPLISIRPPYSRQKGLANQNNNE